jgi:putative tryptophan/tyrosine transport system substrate-binding protein
VTANIPIVFGVGGDPIKLGLVGSLNRPGGNLTGVTAMAVELAPKQLELLHELMPTTTAVAVLVNPTIPALAETTLGDLHAATRTRGLQLHVVHASTDSDLETAFASVANPASWGTCHR